MAKHLVITGTSAMQAWDEGVGSYARTTRISSPATFAASAEELRDFTTLPQGCTEPVQIMVGDRAKRLHTKRWDACLRVAPMPPKSLVDIGGDRCLITPEYFFLQVAPKLSVVRATLLGLELCGWYSTLMSSPYKQYCDEVRRKNGGRLLSSPWPPTEWDMSLEHQKDLMDNGFVVRPPLTNTATLRRNLESLLSSKSNSRALVAAKLVVDSSRSPMESHLYARYCLPRRYGGLNLHPVEMNREFDLSADVVAATGIQKYSVDLFFPDGGVGVEYQGHHAHSGLSAEQRDRLKRNLLETQGVRVISIDKQQYANEDMLDFYGREIAKSMGIAKWQLKPTAREQLKRDALVRDLREWDFDLYRPDAR